MLSNQPSASQAMDPVTKSTKPATATRAFSGFGSHHMLHTPKIELLAQHLPIRIEFVETAEKVDELFVWAVGHKADDAQRELALAHINKHAANKKLAYENILWALLNTKEFKFNE